MLQIFIELTSYHNTKLLANHSTNINPTTGKQGEGWEIVTTYTKLQEISGIFWEKNGIGQG